MRTYQSKRGKIPIGRFPRRWWYEYMSLQWSTTKCTNVLLHKYWINTGTDGLHILYLNLLINIFYLYIMIIFVCWVCFLKVRRWRWRILQEVEIFEEWMTFPTCILATCHLYGPRTRGPGDGTVAASLIQDEKSCRKVYFWVKNNRKFNFWA
jgi:hypothetical protein